MADRFCGSSTNVPRSIMALLMRSARLASRTTGALPMRAALRASAPSRTQPRRWNQQAAAESHIFDETDAMRRQLLYRSKQRGERPASTTRSRVLRAPYVDMRVRVSTQAGSRWTLCSATGRETTWHRWTWQT